MADLEDIVQRVAIEGTGEAGHTLSELATVAESAFRKISDSAGQGGSVLAVFGVGVGSLIAAIAAGAYALSNFVANASHTVIQLDALGKSFGTTAAGVEGLRSNFARYGIAAEQVNRAMARTSASLANSYSQIRQAAREAGSQQESAAERVVGAAIGVETAQNRAASVSQEWSLKLRSDAAAVSDAWTRLKFASADMASQTSNNMLSMESASLGLLQAEQKLKDFRTGTTDKVAAKALEQKQLELAVDQARQRVADAQLKVAKGPDTSVAKAQLGLEQAQFKQGQDVDQSFLAVKTAALDLAKALTGAKEAAEHAYNVQLRDLANIESLLQGRGGTGQLNEVGTRAIVRAIEDLANKQAASGKASPLETWKETQEVFRKGVLDLSQKLSIMQQFGFQTRSGGATGAAAVQAFEKSTDFTDIAKEAQKHPGALNAEDVAQAQKNVAVTEQLKSKFEELTLKISTAGGSISDFTINLKLAIAQLLTSMQKPDAASGGRTTAVEGHAGGGEIHGPGGPRSDSIVARLSDGEFVQQQAAVQFWGRDFMHAINNMQMPGFAMGGLVSPVRLAAASPSKSSTGLTLVLDGKRFEGMSAPQDVADSLARHSINRQAASTGRQPSWNT